MSNRKMTITFFISIVLLALVAFTAAADGPQTVPPTVTKSVSPENINLAGSGGQETTTVTIEITGAGGTSTTITPMDVVFALDSSGSMVTSDPTDLRISAAQQFIDKMDVTRDLAGAVSWDNDIDFTVPMSADFAAVKAQIGLVDSNGGTNLNVGLTSAIGVLDAGKQEGSVRVIIFLTDGEGTYTSAMNGGPASDAASKGYVIYSIGLGSPAAGPLIDMADATGGAYYNSPSAENLQAIFDAIFEEVVTSTIPYNVDVKEVTQDYIIEEGSFNIAPDSQTDNTFTWENVGMINDGDPDMSADETVTLTFEAKSNMVGTDLPVQDFGNAEVTYTDNEGSNPGSVDIPQDYITVNAPPDCSEAYPSVESLWPPNHKFVAVDVLGVTDPEGDDFSINIDSIFQDEPTDTTGDGQFAPDGSGVGTSTAEVRAERVGTPQVPGNGRFYHISFTATDEFGAACSGTVLVSVPHDQATAPIDDGPLYDSTN